jgi:hypothetical protein
VTLTEQLGADTPTGVRQPGSAPAGVLPGVLVAAAGRPVWWGLVPLTAGAASVPLLLVDPMLAGALGLVCVALGLLGARTSRGRERRQHLAAAALGTATVVLLVGALTVLDTSLGQVLPDPPPVATAPSS